MNASLLSGEKVRLEHLRLSDAAVIEAWLHDEEATRYMILGRTAPSAQRWVAELADGWPRHAVMAIKPKCDPMAWGIVGLFDLDWLARKGELRIVMGKYRGGGNGTEAVALMVRYGFQSLGLHRIWLGTSANNLPAQGCFRRAGFKEEGRLREDFFTPDGRWEDNVRMAILRAEWMAQQ